MEGTVGDFVDAEMAEKSDTKDGTQEWGSEGWGRIERVGRGGRECLTSGRDATSLCPGYPLMDSQPPVPAVLDPSVFCGP